MAGVASKFVSTGYTKFFLKPVQAINKKIHEITGKPIFVGNPPKSEEGGSPSANFRQVGRTPEDKSGFPTQHLGGK